MKFENVDLKALEAELIEFRRDLHKYPESAWTEFRTTAKIIEKLEELNLPVKFGQDIHVKEKMYGLPSEAALEACYNRALSESDRPDLIEKMKGGYTGCITLIKGEKPGPRIGIRVDIDCNDVDECKDADHIPNAEGFASVHKACMHACGHDGHASIGVGIAKILTECREELSGEVLLVFQPAEEGLRGAASIAASGLCDSCDYFLSAHIGIKDMPLGTVAASSYGLLCSTKFDAEFIGKAAHAGLSPSDGKNAMAAACAAVLNMLAIPRHKDGTSRINVGTFHSGTGRNVIPEQAVISCETRGVTTAINSYMQDQAMRICRAAALMWDCELKTRFMGAAGGIECDKPLVEKVCSILKDDPAVENIIESIDFGGGEDVTAIMERVQKNGGQVTEMMIPMHLKAPHHNGAFNIEEKVIILAAEAFARIAIGLGKQ